MTKLALLIAVDNPVKSGKSSSEADARLFADALRSYWNFNDDEVVLLTSAGSNKATRAEVERQFKRIEGLNLKQLIVGFWGVGIHQQGDDKRRFCLADYKAKNAKSTTVSLQSLLSAAMRLGARDVCFILDGRPISENGEYWRADEGDCKTIERYIRKTAPGFRTAALASCSASESPIDVNPGKVGLFTHSLVQGMDEFARRYQGSFDSVAGFAIQTTTRKAAELGKKQQPYFESAGDGDIRFDITQGFRQDSSSVVPNVQDSLEDKDEPDLGNETSIALDKDKGGKKATSKLALALIGIGVAVAVAALATFIALKL